MVRKKYNKVLINILIGMFLHLRVHDKNIEMHNIIIITSILIF